MKFFMKKILLLAYSLYVSSWAIVSYASSNFTETSFTVNVAALNPMWGWSTPPGVWALELLLNNVADVILFMIPILAGISFLIAGYFYIFSAGDSEKVWKAKTIIKWNIIAMIIAFLSWAIINIIASFF